MRSFEAPTSADFYPPPISHQKRRSRVTCSPALIFTHVTADTLSPSVTTDAPSMFERSEICTTITYAVIIIASNSNRLIKIALCFAHLAPPVDLLFSSVVGSYRHHTVSAQKPPTALRVASDSQCRSGSPYGWSKKGESIQLHSHQISYTLSPVSSRPTIQCLSTNPRLPSLNLLLIICTRYLIRTPISHFHFRLRYNIRFVSGFVLIIFYFCLFST